MSSGVEVIEIGPRIGVEWRVIHRFSTGLFSGLLRFTLDYQYGYGLLLFMTWNEIPKAFNFAVTRNGRIVDARLTQAGADQGLADGRKRLPGDVWNIVVRNPCLGASAPSLLDGILRAR